MQYVFDQKIENKEWIHGLKKSMWKNKNDKK